TASSPAIIRRSVDFPQPDGPTRTMNSPLPTFRSRSWITWAPPGKTLFTPSRTISDIRTPPGGRSCSRWRRVGPPMAFRMLVCDVDGTLLDPDGRLTDRTADAVARLVAGGVRVVLASGRILPGLVP